MEYVLQRDLRPTFLTETSSVSKTHAHLLDSFSPITELRLERKHIRRLQSMNDLTHLRIASFADNELSSIDGGLCLCHDLYFTEVLFKKLPDN